MICYMFKFENYDYELNILLDNVAFKIYLIKVN